MKKVAQPFLRKRNITEAKDIFDQEAFYKKRGYYPDARDYRNALKNIVDDLKEAVDGLWYSEDYMADNPGKAEKLNQEYKDHAGDMADQIYKMINDTMKINSKF